MNPFRKRSPAEAAEELRAARAAYDSVPAELQHLIAASDEDFLEGVAESIQVEDAIKVEHARPLTPQESAKQDGELLFARIMGDSLDNLIVDRESLELELEEDLDRKSDSSLQVMIRETVRDVVAKAVRNQPVGRENDRSGVAITPRPLAARLAESAVDFEASRELVEFLKAYAQGDEVEMRRVARELAAA